MIPRAPLEEQVARGNVDLLQHTVEGPAVDGASERAEICFPWIPEFDDGSVVGRDLELGAKDEVSRSDESASARAYIVRVGLQSRNVTLASFELPCTPNSHHSAQLVALRLDERVGD